MNYLLTPVFRYSVNVPELVNYSMLNNLCLTFVRVNNRIIGVLSSRQLTDSDYITLKEKKVSKGFAFTPYGVSQHKVVESNRRYPVVIVAPEYVHGMVEVYRT